MEGAPSARRCASPASSLRLLASPSLRERDVGSVHPSGLLVGADYLLRIRALESQSHSGRVVDLRCVLTYPQLLAGTVADRLGKLLMLTRSMCRPSRRPGFHYSVVDILAKRSAYP